MPRRIFTALLVLAAAAPQLAGGQSPTDEFTRSAFAAADRNGDGFVDEAELVNDAIVGFVAADTDADDAVTAADLDPADRANMAAVDADGDGRLTVSEVMNRKLADFRAADTNADGALSLEEALAHDRAN